ncbi:MAG: stringent starvation protein B [Proteobacteria bacterium]|nr:stringent starvation protein B [Pseudomonadota bacterium]MBW3616329.1 stringent starvation protein B [Pseudomonadota bacterium]
MTDTGKPEDLMDYEGLAQEALRGVVRGALRRGLDPQGLPGAHHFYITFKTHGPGVSAPADLLTRYPDEMTIVLQHQYWDLQVDETQFAITLKFGGQPKRMVVPYAAVTRFYDPSVQFLLQFEATEPASAPVVSLEPASTPALRDANAEPPPAPNNAEAAGPKIVSLDQFRKK